MGTFKKIAILLLFSSQILLAEDKLVFSAISDSIDSEIVGLILEEAYERLGIEVEIKEYPGLRALQYSNEGVTDGEVNRVEGLDNKFRNLIPVPVVLSKIEAVAFTINPEIVVESREDLKKYKVGIRRGAKFAEDEVKALNHEMVYNANTEEKLYKMLLNSRVDLIIAPAISVLFIKSLFKEIDIYASPALKTLPLYHYLHKKHEKLIPEITIILQDMEKEGRINEIKESVIKSRLKKK